MTPDQQTETPSLEKLEEILRSRHPAPRGELLADFARVFHSRTHASYFSKYTLDKLEAAVVSMFDWLDRCPADDFAIRVITPPWLETVSATKHSAVEVTGPDQPFLVDSLRELARVRSRPAAEILHPILSVHRDASGRIDKVLHPGSEGKLTSFMHLETDEVLTKKEARELEDEAKLVFADVREVVRDFPAMSGKVRSSIARLSDQMKTVRDLRDREDHSEAIDFLEWLLRANFVFLGAREYRLESTPDGLAAAVVRGSGLGILRHEERSSLWQPRLLSELDADLRARVLDTRLLTVHKTNAESHVLRRTRMDYIGLKFLDAEGSVCGEQRFIGLFTARALGELPANIPVLRRKLDQILRKARVVPGSHDHKEIFSTFCSLPKPQLFLYDTDALDKLISDVLHQRHRQQIRVHYQEDALGLTIAAMVLIPRERFNAEVRRAIQKLLADEFRAAPMEYHLAISDEPMARLHFYYSTKKGESIEPPIARLEAGVARITKTWEETVSELLQERHGFKKGLRLAAKYTRAFPASYRAQETAEAAASDIGLLERTLAKGRPQVRAEEVSRGEERGAHRDRRKPRRLKEFTLIKITRVDQPFHLSLLMPTLTHLGLEVLDETSYAIESRRLRSVFLHTFRVLGSDGRPVPCGDRCGNLEDTIVAVLDGGAVDDSLNALVASTGLSWRQVDLLRTYTSYLRQIEVAIRQRTAYLTLEHLPSAAEALVRLFEGRFDPSLTQAEREERQAAALAGLKEIIDSVEGIQEDRILRGYENLILATVRTNYFQRTGDAERRPALAVKVRCADVARMPQPRPLFETFVSNPWVEGIHMRSGKVARGGIRWSDRTDDFRTEVLGLMKSQRTKNALIVPVGAKGGFVLKRPPRPEALAEEVRRRYETFIGALLDVTDNVVDAETVSPPDTVIYDESDPYLVVAADRGTAQFSDLANEIAMSRSFWLGDAFASGGSTGYNHKEEGITARGAWECVKRHFRARGIDIQKQEFTVAGIGDMSGDVFGNGMLLSPKTLLVAAFNHRHIFLDPTPDPKASLKERQRLFDLPRSAWTDYREKVISRGGGVYSRGSKSIPLSPEARRLLDVDSESLNGDELVRAILRMPVDLLWNGGIGTFIKASTESHFEVGDTANDPVRVNASQVRARVIGEGGNLGVTPRGRVEFARNGGRINTDFIDNSAGVDLSDHEVNLKILLDGAVTKGKITTEERNRLLKDVAAEVSEHVLRDNRLQSDAISVERRRDIGHLPQVRALIRDLVARGLLQRSLEAIPESSEFDKLAESSMGLTRPQLSVVLAYAKIDAYSRMIQSELPDRPEFSPYLTAYFPRSFPARFSAEIENHPLRREITVTAAVNDCVNDMGVTFLHRVSREEKRGFPEVLEAFVVAAELARSSDFYDALEPLYSDMGVPITLLEDARILYAEGVERLARWHLRRRMLESDGGLRDRIAADIERLRQGAVRTEDLLEELDHKELAQLGDPVLRHLAHVLDIAETADISWLAETAGASIETARLAFESAGDRLLIGKIARRASRMARASLSDWQMCSSLTAALDDMRTRLARRLIEGLEGSERASDRPPAHEVAELASRLVPDRDPRRREMEAMVEGQQPVTPSGLFVLVEGLRQLMPDADR